jgi:phosphopantothenoylcysteine decarboxylase/phosphopantothenate--cysteine ligase
VLSENELLKSDNENSTQRKTMSKIVIGVSGGIAAFKSAVLVSELVQQGHEVDVVMTRAAKQFIGPATFTALTGRPVAMKTFDSRFPLGAHIELARGADVLCIAPATANFLAKAAGGIADDLLSTLYLCFTAPVLMAPAMNNEMWIKPAVQRNLAQLKSDGVCII